MIWIFINGRILGRSLSSVHTSLLRVSYCELVRKFMDDVTTLVGDKRRRCRLLRRVLCLVQSSQPSSKNIFRRRAKGEKKKTTTCTLPQCDTEIRYFCFVAFVDHCDRSFLFYQFFGCVCLICTKFPAGESIQKDVVIDLKYAAGIILTHLQ